MNFLVNSAWAAEAPPPGGGFMPLLMLIVFFAAFWLLLIRPQQKRAKEHRAMIDALSAGDEVLTGGGVLGRITKVSEQFITIEIAKDVEIRVQRQTVGKLMPKGTIKNA